MPDRRLQRTRDAYKSKIVCPECRGKGYLPMNYGHWDYRACPVCLGARTVNEENTENEGPKSPKVD